ncbi:MAG: hypothetical protein WCV67_14980 [Victivallaceae bacterium]|jgi:uncharacterized secreted protein with C-terminal beta-propeller domain
MKKLLIVAASCLIVFGTAQVYAADEAAGKDRKADPSKTAASDTSVAKKGKAQTLCPVMGGEIDKNLYVDVKGKRIYVCCKGCVGMVKADPGKYIKILEDQGVEIEKAPASSSK